jgi:uncharacterized protein (DUF1330 family)
MTLLEKVIAKQKELNLKERSMHYGKLIAIGGTKPAIVNGEEKERVIVIMKFGDVQATFGLFKDSVYGLPNYVPQGGIDAAIMLVENGEFVNAVHLGVAA